MVDQSVYLDVMFNFNGNFFYSRTIGNEPYLLLINNETTLPNHCTLLSHFHAYVCKILNYGCEVCGSHKGPDIKKVNLEVLWYVLGVCKNTNTSIVYFETGRLPLYYIRIFRMFKFLFKVMQAENYIPRASYKCVYRIYENSKKYCSN